MCSGSGSKTRYQIQLDSRSSSCRPFEAIHVLAPSRWWWFLTEPFFIKITQRGRTAKKIIDIRDGVSVDEFQQFWCHCCRHPTRGGEGGGGRGTTISAFRTKTDDPNELSKQSATSVPRFQGLHSIVIKTSWNDQPQQTTQSSENVLMVQYFFFATPSPSSNILWWFLFLAAL